MGLTINTVGDLKKALASVEDNLRVAAVLEDEHGTDLLILDHVEAVPVRGHRADDGVLRLQVDGTSPDRVAIITLVRD